MAFDSPKHLAIYVEYANHLICTRSEDELPIEDHETPYRAFMSYELRRDIAIFDIPHEDLSVPSTADNLTPIFTECQARDISGMTDEHAMRIFFWRPSNIFDEYERFSSTSCH